MARMTSMNGATAASIMPEWNACEVCSGVVAIPRARNSWSTASTSALGPDITVAAGVLMAAIEMDGGSSGVSCSAGVITANMAPPGMLCMRRPRAATARNASSSENTSARQAETNSPML